MKIPRILLAAGASGSGKTLITCGLLQALVNRGLKVASFKCGPDYIDPMFHSRVIGTRSRNLDTFFTDGDRTRYLLAKNASDCEIAVMEGVMGYYDGVGGITSRASAYDLASTTDTPVILIVNSRGMSVSLAAYVKGFLEYKKDSHICGVIFNQMSPMLYPRMKKLLEEELSVKVLGYVPKVEDCVIESRHLGLVLPEEIPELKSRLQKLSEVLEKTLDIDGILELAGEAPELAAPETEMLIQKDTAFGYRTEEKVRIGVADDEAFCFFYADNLNLLEQMGAELVRFSPIHDRELPEDLDGLLLSGGYPELNGEALEENQEMCTRIREVILDGMPCLAECGGFMYLHQEMEDMEGKQRRVCGVIPGRAYRTPKLNRFGYITLTEKQDTGLGEIPAHEFHYFDSTDCGADFHAAKPASKRGWDCIHDRGRLMAGFPHLYYYGNPRVPARFLKNALEYNGSDFDSGLVNCSLVYTIPQNAVLQNGDTVGFEVVDDATGATLVDDDTETKTYADITIEYKLEDGSDVPNTKSTVFPAAVGTKVDWELPKELNGYTLVKSEGTDKTVGTGGLTVTCYYKAKEDRPSASFIITDESGAEADKTLKAGKFKAKLTLPEGRKTAAVIIAKYVNGTLGDLKMSEPKETQAIIETDFITVTGEDLTKQTEIKAFVFESTENIKPMYGFQHIIK